MRSTEGLPTYSTLEVAKHASAEDAWLIVGGKVLDVTSWLDDHPGGDVVLLDLVGRDATREFEDVGHSADARARLDTLVVGTIRAATNEELRISKRGSGTGSKVSDVGVKTAEMVYDWVQENFQTLKTVGTASAFVVGMAIILRRYGSNLFSSGRR